MLLSSVPIWIPLSPGWKPLSEAFLSISNTNDLQRKPNILKVSNPLLPFVIIIVFVNQTCNVQLPHYILQVSLSNHIWGFSSHSFRYLMSTTGILNGKFQKQLISYRLCIAMSSMKSHTTLTRTWYILYVQGIHALHISCAWLSDQFSQTHKAGVWVTFTFVRMTSNTKSTDSECLTTVCLPSPLSAASHLFPCLIYTLNFVSGLWRYLYIQGLVVSTASDIQATKTLQAGKEGVLNSIPRMLNFYERRKGQEWQSNQGDYVCLLGNLAKLPLQPFPMPVCVC